MTLSDKLARLQGGRVWMPKAHVDELLQLGLMLPEHLPAASCPPEGMDVYIRSICLTFGNKKSVPVFTLLARQVLRVWRTRGWPVAHLLDDYGFAPPWLGSWALSYENAVLMRNTAIADLETLGILVNYEKSMMTPAQQLPEELAASHAPASQVLDEGWVAVDLKGELAEKLATLVTTSNSWSTKLPVWNVVTGERRALRPHEAEAAMEIPVGYTQYLQPGVEVPLNARLKMVGNAWHVRTTSALLASGATKFGARGSNPPAMNTEAALQSV